MPIHEFQCQSCGFIFEILLMSKNEMEDVRCAKCASPEVSRLISASNIAVSDSGPKGSAAAKSSSYVTHHQCQSGSCSQLNLAGHTKE